MSACIHAWPHDDQPDEVLASLEAVATALEDALKARRGGLPFGEQWGWVHVVQEQLAYVLITLSQDEDEHMPLVEDTTNGVH